MIEAIRSRVSAAGLAAPLAVGLILACLAVGYEPTQGDPDLMYRPIKAELARALARGELPLWSHRLGLGVPLVAESHVAAFYPPNWLFYSALSVAAAFRLALWLHSVAAAAATFAYARVLGLTAWGASLAALAFALCGFQAMHSGHEPLYHAVPFLPFCLLAAHQFAESGRSRWLAALALAWGAQITVGHFQIQLWTAGLVMLTGAWRVLADHRPKRRILGLALAVALGACVAAPQLTLTWELRSITGFARAFEQLTTFNLPPSHCMQLVLPALFVPNPLRDPVPYWGPLASAAAEATFYVGTVPVILACVGLIGDGRSRTLAPWRLIAAASLALATMPRWWEFGYWLITCIPGVGWFRCSGRYTLITSLGIALLAGHGLDRSISAARFRRGVGLAVVLALASFAGGVLLTKDPNYRASFGEATIPYRFGSAVLIWSVSLAMVMAWRSGRLGAWALVAFTAVELGTLYHLGPVVWGRSVPIVNGSPVLNRLAEEPGIGLISGPIENLPVRKGLTPAYPYLGIPAPPPNYLLEPTKWIVNSGNTETAGWMRRFGVTHGVWHEGDRVFFADTIWVGHDPRLDKILKGTSDTSPAAPWKIVRYRGTWPAALACRGFREAEDWGDLYRHLTGTEDQDEAWYLPEDLPLDRQSPRATVARVRSWDQRTAVVEHDGTCDLVIRRTFYPGWTARLDDGTDVRVCKVNGGLQSVRLEGSGTSRVRFSYEPPRLKRALMLSLGSIALCVLAGIAGLFRPRRATQATATP